MKSQIGHDLPQGKLLHSRRSKLGSLQTGHSLSATEFVGLNFGYAAITDATRPRNPVECCRPMDVPIFAGSGAKLIPPHKTPRYLLWNSLRSSLLFISSTMTCGTSMTRQPFPRCYNQISRSGGLSVRVRRDIPSLPITSISCIKPLGHTNATFSTWLPKAISVLRECAFREHTVETSLPSSQQGRR